MASTEARQIALELQNRRLEAPLFAAFSWRDAGSMMMMLMLISYFVRSLQTETNCLQQLFSLATSSNDEIASIRGHVFGRHDRL